MTSITQQTQAAQTALFDQTGAFFAFSNEQYSRKAVPGVDYVSLGAGMIVPKANAKALVSGLESISKTAVERDLNENGKTKIIRRELLNYECHYTGSIDDCVYAIEHYGITREEIQAVYQDMLANGEVEF